MFRLGGFMNLIPNGNAWQSVLDSPAWTLLSMFSLLKFKLCHTLLLSFPFLLLHSWIHQEANIFLPEISKLPYSYGLHSLTSVAGNHGVEKQKRCFMTFKAHIGKAYRAGVRTILRVSAWLQICRGQCHGRGKVASSLRLVSNGMTPGDSKCPPSVPSVFRQDTGLMEAKVSS